MNIRNKFRPDYAALYPDVKISDEIMTVLKQSDRKAEYMERDLKTERTLKSRDGKVVRDNNGNAVRLPARECSLERLWAGDLRFTDETRNPERILLNQELRAEILLLAKTVLTENERAVLITLFFEDMSEMECAERMGVSQPRVSQLRRRALEKLWEALKKY
jgi:RNA polymerase sigma factor (sigma-70 family)